MQSYGGLLAARFFLGFAESGTFPGCEQLSVPPLNIASILKTLLGFYLISMWYKRDEAQRRFSFFFGSTTLAGAFGSLLASAIGNMDGMRGYHAWRWIFILEGVLTCVVAFAAFFIITDFPEDATWLSKTEKIYVKTRLETDQGISELERKVTGKDVLHVIIDYKTALGTLMYFGLIVPAYVCLGTQLVFPTPLHGITQRLRRSIVSRRSHTLHPRSSSPLATRPYLPSCTLRLEQLQALEP